MPVKRRVPKRRIAELPDACFRFLADLIEPGDEGSDAMVQFEFLSWPLDIEEAWRRFGIAAIGAHQAVRGPNSMPRLWFRYGLPGNDDGGEAA